MGPSLLIMACPYCGAAYKNGMPELNRVEGHCVESVAVWCEQCDEECVIDRNVDTSFREDTDDEA